VAVLFPVIIARSRRALAAGVTHIHRRRANLSLAVAVVLIKSGLGYLGKVAVDWKA
jgi:hypothetical protein